MIRQPYLGIIGGSGIYDLPDFVIHDTVKSKTDFGAPSDTISVGSFEHVPGLSIAFLPRHGKRHKLLPHQIPYRANMAAFAKLGIKAIIATCICGSLKRAIKPGTHVVLDQFFNFTSGREPRGAHSGIGKHIEIANPYCDCLRRILIRTLKNDRFRFRRNGSVLVIDGPRFNSVVESRTFSKLGLDVVNMTQFPEVLYAREERICYVSLASVTDYDSGVGGDSSVLPHQYARMVQNFWNCVRQQKMILSVFASRLDKVNLPPCIQCGIHYSEFFRIHAKR